MTTTIETQRLILRTWKKEDADPYFQINQDPKVIELLRGPLSMEQVNDFIFAVNNHQDKHANVRSLRVMEKIGLKRDLNGDFAHPKLAADHRLSQHILYRLTADEYEQGCRAS